VESAFTHTKKFLLNLSREKVSLRADASGFAQEHNIGEHRLDQAWAALLLERNHFTFLSAIKIWVIWSGSSKLF
jgi:hypothetical protein